VDPEAAVRQPQAQQLLVQRPVRQPRLGAGSSGGCGGAAATDTPTKAFLVRQKQLANSKSDSLDSFIPDDSPAPAIAGFHNAAANTSAGAGLVGKGRMPLVPQRYRVPQHQRA
jgi:hypothetical protein